MAAAAAAVGSSSGSSGSRSRTPSGFADAANIASPPSLFGGLDAIRRGLNVDFQRGDIDIDTHQALLNDAGRAFGGTRGGGTTHVVVELDGVRMAEATVATVNAARNRGELD